MLMEPDAEVCPLRVIGPISFVTINLIPSICSPVMSIERISEMML